MRQMEVEVYVCSCMCGMDGRKDLVEAFIPDKNDFFAEK